MISLLLAWRFLREGATQTALIISGVGVGVGAFLFISLLMGGLYNNLLSRTLGSQSHITIDQEEDDLTPVLNAKGTTFLRHVEPGRAIARPFSGWQHALERVKDIDGVVTISPKVNGSALAIVGGTERSVQVVGVELERYSDVVDIASAMTAGRYQASYGEAIIGELLAEELSISLGDRLRIRTAAGDSFLRIVGLFDLEQKSVDGGWVLMNIRQGQALLDRPGDITAIDVQVDEVFDADKIATEIAATTGLEVESWIDRSGQILSALRSQKQSTTMIRLFVLLAVAMGIASVLVVSVVQRRPQIGILRAIGLKRRVVMGIFLWQGVILGLCGAGLGIAVGMGALQIMRNVLIFPIENDLRTVFDSVVIALLTGVLSAFLPARTASKLDPAVAIRGDS